jgi:hypothetical protein
MPLATKNNAIILKDGLLAEDCGCCGGWYCCADPTCRLQELTSVTVTLASTGYLLHRQYAWSCNSYESGSQSLTYTSSAGFDASGISGTHSLSKQSSVLWSKQLPSSGGCGGSIDLNISQSTAQLIVTVFASAHQTVGVASYKSLSQLACVSPVNTWTGAYAANGDVAQTTYATSISATLSSGACFSGDFSSVFPISTNVLIPFFAYPVCTERQSTGVVSTNLEAGSKLVSITGVSLT